MLWRDDKLHIHIYCEVQLWDRSVKMDCVLARVKRRKHQVSAIGYGLSIQHIGIQDIFLGQSEIEEWRGMDVLIQIFDLRTIDRRL